MQLAKEEIKLYNNKINCIVAFEKYTIFEVQLWDIFGSLMVDCDYTSLSSLGLEWQACSI